MTLSAGSGSIRTKSCRFWEPEEWEKSGGRGTRGSGREVAIVAALGEDRRDVAGSSELCLEDEERFVVQQDGQEEQRRHVVGARPATMSERMTSRWRDERCPTPS